MEISVLELNRSLQKLAYDRQMLEAPHRRAGAYDCVREDSRSGVTTQLLSEVEFSQRSNEIIKIEPLILLDVRQKWEYDLVKIEGSINIPLNELLEDVSLVNDFPKNIRIVTICHHGVRSLNALMFLRAQGFNEVVSLKGGIDEWARVIDKSAAVY